MPMTFQLGKLENFLRVACELKSRTGEGVVYRRLTFRFYVDHWLGQVSISSGRAATGSLGERRGSRERGEGVGVHCCF